MRVGAVVAGVVPFFLIPPPDVVPDAEGEEEEEGNPGVFRQLIFAATLTALAIMFRPPRGNPGSIFARAEDDGLEERDTGLLIPKRRRRKWLLS